MRIILEKMRKYWRIWGTVFCSLMFGVAAAYMEIVEQVSDSEAAIISIGAGMLIIVFAALIVVIFPEQPEE